MLCLPCVSLLRISTSWCLTLACDSQPSVSDSGCWLPASDLCLLCNHCAVFESIRLESRLSQFSETKIATPVKYRHCTVSEEILRHPQHAEVPSTLASPTFYHDTCQRVLLGGVVQFPSTGAIVLPTTHCPDTSPLTGAFIIYEKLRFNQLALIFLRMKMGLSLVCRCRFVTRCGAGRSTQLAPTVKQRMYKF